MPDRIAWNAITPEQWVGISNWQWTSITPSAASSAGIFRVEAVAVFVPGVEAVRVKG